MFSNSSTFLAGGNSSRPGPSQYGQSSFSNAQQGPQQQSGFQQQPPGFSGGQLQTQYTGYPGQGQQQQSFQAPQQQPQYTGYPQNQQPAQGAPPTQQPFQTGPPSHPPIAPQQTSSQIAQSFQSTPAAIIPTIQSSTTGTKIPKIRLSFLTAQDQAKFEQLFKSAVGDGQSLDGGKVKDLLIRSKLPGSDLMKIWVLSDTTKSGQLLFPEFALAMYLCNLRLVGKDLPQTLPERIANEVSSMVDIISFGVPDDRPQPPPRSNAPNFDSPSGSTPTPSIQQPQPQASNSQLLSQLTSQPTGFAAQYIPPQPTGFSNQPTGFGPQPISAGQQQNKFQQNPQASSYSGPRPAMPPLPSNYSSNVPPAQTGQPLSLNAQQTGLPGQWGLVNAPASGLPNIEALQQRMMPQPGREGGYTTAGLSGSATVPWAVTKDEKKIYDQLFKAWDGFNKGFIGGDVAIEVMGQSGLPKVDLEKIWTLSDPGNKGKLDMDEFAVAMHLIYRKLNGYPVPNQLPPELVPPSTRNFAESIGTVKSLLSQDAETRKNSSAFLQPQQTGVSYLKNRSFRTDSNGIAPGRKDATVFRNNDDDIGYKSSARRRLGAGGRTPSPVQPNSPSAEISHDDLPVEQLRKKVREKQILLDAIDFREENEAEDDDVLDRRDRRDAEDLYRRIRRIQKDLDTHPNASFRDVNSDAERRNLKRQLQRLTDRLPELASNVRKTERNIADAKLELFRLKDAKAHPGAVSAVVGTGPGGAVTEADRLKARAKALMQQRSAALTGKSSPAGQDDSEAASRRLEEESSRVRTEKENNERMIKDVEDSVQDFSHGLEDSLMRGSENSTSEHERRRWEDGLGVEDEVRDFIYDLQRSSRSSKLHTESSRGRGDEDSRDARRHDSPRDRTPTRSDRNKVSDVLPHPAANSSSTGTYSSYKTAEDRAAFIKQQAEQRMAERLAALGLKPPTKSGESTQQRQEREARERQERVRQAEAEDDEREEERQRRLADEQPTPPKAMSTQAKKPPPPPSRKNRADSASQRVEAKRKADEAAAQLEAEQKAKEQAIRDQQQAQEAQVKGIEDETERQEHELAKEREASQARLRALEEQVKQGKVKKQEEKRRKQAAEKEAKEREAKLVAQRAELETAKEKERQLQLQLESLGDDDSSDDEGPQEITPQETTPTNSQILSREDSTQPMESSTPSRPAPTESPATTTPPPTTTSQTSSTYNESKNPFFKKLNQPTELASNGAQSSSSIASSVAAEVSTNPFHRLSQQESASKTPSQPQSQPTFPTPLSSTVTSGHRPSRVRPEEDEWSVVDSTEDSDEETDQPTGGSAKHLASILFGTMAPPRPLSAMDEKDKPRTPYDSPSTPSAPPMPSASAPPPPPIPSGSAYGGESPGAPPPPPPMPSTGAPPPPPMPSMGAPPPPPPPPVPGMGAQPPSPLPNTGAPPAVAGLLGDIVKGKGLRKVETKDRSQASVAGRVLG